MTELAAVILALIVQRVMTSGGLKERTVRKISLIAIAVLALLTPANTSWGVVVAGWDMNGLGAFGPSPFSPTEAASGVTVGGLTRGSGVATASSASAAANAWGGNGMAQNSLAAAIAGGDFITFSFTPDPLTSLSLTQIDAYNIRRSGTGPDTGQWQYQVGAGSFVDIGTAITWGTNTAAAGNLQGVIDLSGIAALQDISASTTVTLRLVNWRVATGGADGGNWYFNNFTAAVDGLDLSIQGTIAAVPEASSFLFGGLALCAAGAPALRRRWKARKA